MTACICPRCRAREVLAALVRDRLPIDRAIERLDAVATGDGFDEHFVVARPLFEMWPSVPSRPS